MSKNDYLGSLLQVSCFSGAVRSRHDLWSALDVEEKSKGRKEGLSRCYLKVCARTKVKVVGHESAWNAQSLYNRVAACQNTKRPRSIHVFRMIRACEGRNKTNRVSKIATAHRVNVGRTNEAGFGASAT